MIRKANSADLDGIMRIIEQTITDMDAAKNYQWNNDYPLRQDFADDIENGDLYILEGSNGEIRGMICVNFDEPEEYNGLNWTHEKRAVILHRMVVNSDGRGRGAGTKLMKFAEEKAAELKHDYIKSDTYSTNKAMNALFRKMGYKYVGDTRFPGREFAFYCYEKALE